jgi:hypothetical protein
MCRLFSLSQALHLVDQGPIFRTFFPGKIPRKIYPQKCWEKMEKVLKKCFSKKFHGIFRGKKMYEKSAMFL